MKSILHSKKDKIRIASRKEQTGFSLIEIMVAVLVLSVGILGVAGLQIVGLKGTHQSQMKVQAMTIVQSLTERMHANKLGVINGHYVDSSSDFVCGDIEDCSSASANCTSAEIAKIDLDNLICGYKSGSSPRVGGLIAVSAGDHVAFVDGELDITCPGTDCTSGEVIISMKWQELNFGKENDSSLSDKDSLVINTRIFR